MIGYKLYKKVYLFTHTTNEAIASLYEAYQITDTARIDTFEHHVLCLGNSITLHTLGRTRPGASPFWEGHWGMCASRPDSDYVHRLKTKLRKYNKKTTVTGINIAVWENNLKCNKDSLFGRYMKGKDFIIVKVGENVRDDVLFDVEFPKLISYCMNYTHNIIIAGSYWRNVHHEETMIRTAREYHIPYVSLFWIFDLYKKNVQFHVGDTIYNVKGQPYTIKTNFITTHPNDYGMKLIADAIYRKIRF